MMLHRLIESWKALSVSRKIFILGIGFLALFSYLGEGMEHLVSNSVYGTGQMLSDTENLIVWLCCILLSASVGCSFIAFVIKLLADSFTGVIKRLASGDRKARISEKLSQRKDEIGIVASAFNGMAERLEKEEEREKMMLASVSHELRSPLTRMSVAVELLRMHSGDSPQADRIAQEIDRMQSLVRSILDYSRIEMVEPETSELDFPSILSDVLENARYEGTSSGCSFSVSMPESLSMVGNADMLAHAFENVLRNALKHAPGGPIEITLMGRQKSCVLTVRDHGPGVPEKSLGSLFIPFFRVDSSRSRTSGGTGMGLAIVENVIRAHHGTVSAENAPGGGLAVSMELPLHPDHSLLQDG